MRRASSLVVCALSLASSQRAFAWDSWCHTLRDHECAPGPDRAVVPWVGPDVAHGPSDEHRRLLEWAFQHANVPDAARLLDLPVFSSAEGRITPAPFSQVTTKLNHSRGVSQFAQLPDFGYSLTDWAAQFMGCPPNRAASAVDCHTFDNHMGALNSNHFVPQAANFYRYYHELALRKAAECKLMGRAVGGRAEEFVEFLSQCDSEALTIEAVGQHYLQDAWSSGHMWERWGSPEFSDLPPFPNLTASSMLFTGLVVGAVSGAIHGSEAKTFTTDPLCSEDPRVRFSAGGALHGGVGDLYRGELLSDPSYAYQRQRLLDCSSAGLAEVYASSSHVMSPSYSLIASPAAPCFDQRVTNAAMVAGFGQVDKVTAFVLAKLANDIEGVTVDDVGKVDFVLDVDLELLATRLRNLERMNPDGTEAASGGLGYLLGVKPNGSYGAASSALPASYVDPPLPWQVTPDGPSPAHSNGELLTHLFSRGHAGAWCAAMDERRLTALRAGARSSGAGSAKYALCLEYAKRHARRRAPKPDPAPEACPGSADSSTAPAHASEQEPRPSLCELLTGGSSYVIDVDAERTDARGPELAEIWCRQSEEEEKEEAKRHRCEPKRPAFTGTAGIIEEGRRAGIVAPAGPGDASSANAPMAPGGSNAGSGGVHDVPGAGASPGAPAKGGSPPAANPNGAVPGSVDAPGCLWGYDEFCMQVPPSDPNRPKGGFDGGDPHFLTLDGLRYDYQTPGDFVVARSGDGKLEVQSRQAPFPGSCTHLSWNNAFAFMVADNRVELYIAQPGAAYVDGIRQTIEPGQTVALSGGGSVVRHARYPLSSIQWPDGSRAHVTERAKSLHLMLAPAPLQRGQLSGLLGNYNGDPLDDLRDGTGAVIALAPVLGRMGTFELSDPQLQGAFTNAWRVPASRSLLSLSHNFPAPDPSAPRTAREATVEELQAARQICQRTGVTESWLDACMEDVRCSSEEAASVLLNLPTPAAVARSSADSDGDGLDGPLEERAQTKPDQADSDQDGASDGLEVAAGTAPLDGTDHPSARGDRVVEVQPGNTLDVQFAIPTSIERADVYLLIDLTGSMTSSLANVRSNLTSAGGVIDSVRAAMPNAHFGVGTFTDYTHTLPVYEHIQDLTADVALVQSAVDRLSARSASDDPPEALFPALYSMSTGEGLAGPSRWPNPRSMSSAFTPCPPGKWGWPCFREGALPLAVAITDAAQHNGPDGMHPYPASTPAPAYGDVTAALSARGVKVVGVAVATNAVAPLNAIALATGAVDGAGAPLVSRGAGSVSAQASEQIISIARAPHDIGVVLRDEPLDDIDISAWLQGVAPVAQGNAALGCRAHMPLVDRDGDGVPESYARIQAGAPVCFSASLRVPPIPPADRPLAFALRASVQADGIETATRRIWLVVPPASSWPAPRPRDSIAAMIPPL